MTYLNLINDSHIYSFPQVYHLYCTRCVLCCRQYPPLLSCNMQAMI